MDEPAATRDCQRGSGGDGLDARHRAVELGEIAALVSAKIRERHPELTDDAVKALTNLYAWTVK